jgi:hypothetical protein
MFRVKRKQLFVDPKVQGALLARVLGYWALYLFAIGVLMLGWQILSKPPAPFLVHLRNLWFDCVPVFAASCLLLPFLATDVVRFSNRFCGPLVRIRDGLRGLARGETVQPVQFRQGDFWQDLGDEFNAVVVKQRCLETDLHRDDEADGAAEEWASGGSNS